MMVQRLENDAKTLASILEGIVPDQTWSEVMIQGLCLDSRAAKHGDCFIALEGSSGHGLQYLSEVTTAGVSVVLSDSRGRDYLCGAESMVPLVFIDDLREQLALISNRFYGYPSKNLATVAITGTNGKTTIASIIAQAIHQADVSAAYVGTLGAGPWTNLEPGVNTTPDLLTLQSHLCNFCSQGIKVCAMEVSSHALEQGRIDGIQIDVAVFSNLTHEHLDFHGSMEAYGKAKQRLFKNPTGRSEPPANAVINIDDPFGREIIEQLESHTLQWPYGVTGEIDKYPRLTTATDIEMGLDGISMQVSSPVGEGLVRCKLIGQFNVCNLLATIASLGALKWTFPEIQKALENISSVPGRMDMIQIAKVSDALLPTVVVDYAHSPDALEQALVSLRCLTNGRLICVFGCGGDRDKDKRAKMGAIAEKLAEVVVLTSDNPRGEKAHDIIRQIMRGQKMPNETLIEEDRESAIRKAIQLARHGDIVLIAGKGHETHQILGTTRVPFSDSQVCRIALSERYVEENQ